MNSLRRAALQYLKELLNPRLLPFPDSQILHQRLHLENGQTPRLVQEPEQAIDPDEREGFPIEPDFHFLR